MIEDQENECRSTEWGDANTGISPSQGDHPVALPRGTMLFEYRIESVLGQGGFGVTYLAEDTLLDERVAIKEFFPSHAAVRANDQSVRARTKQDSVAFREGVRSFLIEARLIARFRHPNIMQVRRFFEAHGTGYMVLDFVVGRSLEEAMAAGPMPQAQIMTITSGILAGLGAIHDCAILHRDLKPRNVILRDNDHPVLIDFGSARDFAARDSSTITQIVSPGYSAPEQYGVGEQGPWSDFYSLGAILYRATTGRPPLDSLRRLGVDPLEPASKLAANRYDEDLLHSIDNLLSIEPSKRSAPAGGIAPILQALDPKTRDRTEPAQRKTARYLASLWPTDRKHAIAIAISATGVFVLGFGTILWDGMHRRTASNSAPPNSVASPICDEPADAAGCGPHQETKASATLTAGTIFEDCDRCPSMVVVPSGVFTMGSNDGPRNERPAHQVLIPHAFAIGQKEVTSRQWKACVAAGGCTYTPTFDEGRAEHPVTDLSWLDAQSFVTWLSKTTGARYRLPSEAEWEYADRAKTTTSFWWGDTVGTDHANCADCGTGARPASMVVGHFAPNRFGLYDTAGNAAEWVEDCWTANYDGSPPDGKVIDTPTCAEHVMRGGSFNTPSSYLRSAARFKYETAVRYYANGFRVARDISHS